MRAFVTGGKGFIGQKLIKTLKDAQIEVVALTKEELDITARRAVLDYFKKPYDLVFHLAAAATQGGHQGDFRSIYETNVTGTVNLLEAAREYKAFVNVGSSSEYGSNKTQPMQETDLPEPEFMYSGTKAAATMICQAMAKEERKPIVTVRPFSVYGPGESDKRFIPTVIRCAKTGETLNLAPGVHDWTYIDDLVDGLIKVAEHAHELSGQIVNLGTGRQLTNDEVVTIVSYAMDKSIHTNRVNLMRKWDHQQVWVNGSTKAKDLGIKFRSFEEGIKDL